MNGHGGARNGAGRKPKQQHYQPEITALERSIADQLPQLLANMVLLANGNFLQVTEIWEPAGLVYRDDYAVGDDGKVVRCKVLAFPDLPADQRVCIRETRTFAAPDRKANEYLINRVAGTPTQLFEVDPDPDGTLEVTAAALEKAAQELAAWRQQMIAQLSSPNSPAMLPMPVTPTE